ncbi:MAG: helix-turn-helix domain-containing protein [Paludibacteraceae bacterium]|nr:helix-turn-helix domain-containing protein [Paludibacteraceae bacterium]
MSKIDYFFTNEAILKTIGTCLKNMRLNIRYSQRELAEISGLARATISAAENGKSITTDALIKILRALQELEILEPFSEYEIVSPMTLAKNAGKLPQKIRNTNKIGQIRQ